MRVPSGAAIVFLTPTVMPSPILMLSIMLPPNESDATQRTQHPTRNQAQARNRNSSRDVSQRTPCGNLMQQFVQLFRACRVLHQPACVLVNNGTLYECMNLAQCF